MTTETNKNLLEKVRHLLDKKDYTISSLCTEIGLENEYEIIVVIRKLENDNKITLKGFDKIYREDGGMIYLAMYGKSN